MNAITQRKLDRLRRAQEEALRFICRVEQAIAEVERADYSTKAFAAAKRSSMDLTRVLADLRRSPWQEPADD